MDRESRREDTLTFLNLSLGSPVVRAAGTGTGELGIVGARFIMAGDPSDGRFSLIEHPIVPRGLAAPVHIHRREDEFSFVLEGRWGSSWDRTLSTQSLAISSTSHVMCGIRFGTPRTRRPVSWKSSRLTPSRGPADRCWPAGQPIAALGRVGA
jgi:hypothetical protein